MKGYYALISILLLLAEFSFFSNSWPAIRPGVFPSPLYFLFLFLLATFPLVFRFFKRTEKREIYFFGAIFVVLLTFKLPYLIYENFFLNADLAVGVEMTCNIKRGISFPVFYYGQFYHGTLHSILGAIFSSLFSCHRAMVFVDLIFIWLTIIVAYYLLKRFSSSYGLFLLLLPFPFLNYLVIDMERGHSIVLFFIFLVTFLTYRIFYEEYRGYFLLGFVSGIGVYQYQPFFVFAAIAGIWAFFSSGKWKEKVLFLPGFVLGAFPLLVSELYDNFATLKSVVLNRVGGIDLGSSLKFIYAPFVFFPFQKLFFALFLISSLYLLYMGYVKRKSKWVFPLSFYFVTSLLWGSAAHDVHYYRPHLMLLAGLSLLILGIALGIFIPKNKPGFIILALLILITNVDSEIKEVRASRRSHETEWAFLISSRIPGQEFSWAIIGSPKLRYPI